MFERTSDVTASLAMIPCNRQGIGANGTSPYKHLQLPWACFDWAHPHGTRCLFFIVPDLHAVALSKRRVTTRSDTSVCYTERSYQNTASYYLYSFAGYRLQTNCLSLRAVTYKHISGYLSNKFNKLPTRCMTDKVSPKHNIRFLRIVLYCS
jgi:hypothetical protein